MHVRNGKYNIYSVRGLFLFKFGPLGSICDIFFAPIWLIFVNVCLFVLVCERSTIFLSFVGVGIEIQTSFKIGREGKRSALHNYCWATIFLKLSFVIFNSVLRIRINYYADSDPGSQKCPYGSGSKTKDEKLHTKMFN